MQYMEGESAVGGQVGGCLASRREVKGSIEMAYSRMPVSTQNMEGKGSVGGLADRRGQRLR